MKEVTQQDSTRLDASANSANTSQVRATPSKGKLGAMTGIRSLAPARRTRRGSSRPLVLVSVRPSGHAASHAGGSTVVAPFDDDSSGDF